MPNRIIRDSARTSQTLDGLSADEERMFWRLTTVADDFGRFEADPRILLAQCFPLKVGVLHPSEVEKWRTGLVEAGAIRLYGVGGRLYGHFPTWTKYQQVRAKVSKFPDPPANGLTCQQTQADARTCEQIPSESESESESESRTPLSGNRARRDAQPPPKRPAKAKTPEAREVLDYLNLRTGRRYEPVEANLRLIRGRLAEPGRTVQQMLDVIDAKTAEWLSDPTRTKYLRPGTLFAPEKFAQYVGALTPSPPELKPETPEETYRRQRYILTGEEA